MNIFTQATRKFRAFQHECRAQGALAQDRFEQAEGPAGAFCELEPDNPHANFLLAQVHLHAGRHAQARAHLERTVRHWPDDPPTWYALAVCLDYLDEPQAALAAYQRTLELAPHWIVALKHMGRCCYRLGDAHGAERVLTRYCAEAPDDKEAHDLLGYVSYRQGHLRLAYGHYAQAHQLDPLNPQLERNARLLYRRSATS